MANEEQYSQETQDSKLMIDHDYDGIKELNNPPPAWLMWIFYGTIVWSVFYVFYYHVFDGPSQIDEYNTEVAEAVANAPVSTFNESSIALINDDAALEAIGEMYISKCNSCHGAASVGPDLSDNAWILGNDIDGVFKTIKYGTENPVMAAYGNQISDEDIQSLASYILVKIKGTETGNTKGPEGKEY